MNRGYSLVVCTLTIAVSAIANAQAPSISEVCTTVTTACVAPGNKPAIRRGMTETIKIKGPFVDQVDVHGVTTGAASVTVSRVAPCGSQCLDVTLSTRPDHNLGMRLVPIFLKNFFGSTAFNAFIVRKGEITGMRQIPDTATWGQTVQVIITGNDIGDTRATVPSHTVSAHQEASSAPGPGTTSFNVVPTGAQTGTSFGVTLGDDAVSGVSGNYRFTIPRRTVVYRAVTGIQCASTPGITAPTLVSPGDNQVFTFPTNPLQGSITLRWTGGVGQFKSNEQYVVEIRPVGGATSASTTGQGVMEKPLLLNRNTSYEWRVKAYNCGLTAPFSSYGHFTLQ